MKRFFSCLVQAAAVVFLLAAPARTETLQTTDALGRRVELSLPVRRVACLSSDALEVMRILGAEGLAVAITDTVAHEPGFWGSLSGLPVAGTWQEVDLEMLAAIKPDLILCYAKSPGQELEARLGPLGIAVLRLDFYRPGTLEAEVELLGRVLDRREQARTFLAWHRRAMDQVRSVAAAAPRPTRVYMESYSPFVAFGPGSGGFDLCRLAGGENIAAAMTVPFPQVTPEWVLQNDPDVLIKAVPTPVYGDKGRERMEKALAAMRGRQGWTNMRAMRQERVCILSGDLSSGPALAVGAAWLAKWLHPEQARGLDPAALHREYLERFQGVPLRGVFALPGE
jgi:iron complex transport system substrate-binding protein